MSPALSQKAEALYALGEFEMALVFFSRGLRLRPDMAVFPLGVDTATEAIENAIGGQSAFESGPDVLLECVIVVDVTCVIENAQIEGCCNIQIC